MFGQYDCSRLQEVSYIITAKAKKVFLKTTNIYKTKRSKHAADSLHLLETKMTYVPYIYTVRATIRPPL